eukprot:CAMPEP_0182917250 /NCGR_PEP_ID=MMETSP0105_2-20130417/1409_1 /TAXON_ID=81532 ORGANISM="Acanthoeca-like sp., Strain 10tr" /NCGR_SAMPLE_ID=MMETSP0105_2 /ASSEMBLY_ACC=CAM_ASM_000205 /LENGTH=203 /DNA_ID=CAMNT_0025054243 /DNA_START=38 /DNA_END=649 /DNA_ORIENTATION=-
MENTAAVDSCGADTAAVSTVPDGANWEEDAQYRSMALDRKLEAEENFAQFMEENPDARAICSDFIKHLLIFKPDDTVAEAKAYFSNFVLPKSAAAEEAAAGPEAVAAAADGEGAATAADGEAAPATAESEATAVAADAAAGAVADGGVDSGPTAAVDAAPSGADDAVAVAVTEAECAKDPAGEGAAVAEAVANDSPAPAPPAE